MLFITKEPRKQDYKDLIDLASSLCTKFILVKRTQSALEIDKNCDKTLDELKPYLIDIQEKDQWPGTLLFEDTATVYYYRVTEESKEILKKRANGLYSWAHPQLPEDLCFLKEDGKTWLITIAHESEAWVNLDNIEELEKLKLIRGIKVLNREDVVDDTRY